MSDPHVDLGEKSVLLVENDPEILDLLALLLQSRFGARTVSAQSSAAAQEELRKNADIGLIVADYNLEEGTAADVVKFLKEEKRAIPVILCTGRTMAECVGITNADIVGFVEKPLIVDPLLDQVSRLIGPTATAAGPAGTQAMQEEYLPLSLSTVLKLSVVDVDLFVRISPAKYVKAFNVGAVFERPDYERYSVKHVDQLWLRVSDAATVISRMAQDIATITKVDSLDANKVYQILSTSLEASQLLVRIGLTPEVIELTRKSVELAARAIAATPSLSELLTRFAVEPERYITTHSIAVAYAGAGLARSIGWSSEPTVQGIILAAFFHDIVLKTQEMARVKTRTDIEGMALLFSEADQKAVLDHPNKAAALLRAYPQCPPYAVSIVEQHHEQPDGSGFPHRLMSRAINPVSALFIVSHDLVDFLSESASATVTQFVHARRDLYRTGRFKAPFEQLVLFAMRESPVP